DGLGDRAGDAQRLERGHPGALHALAQGLAVEVLEREVGPPVVDPELVDRDDVGMAEAGRRARLLGEAAEAVVLRDAGLDQLERAGTPEPHVACRLAVAGRALADALLDLERADLQTLRDLTGRIGHPAAPVHAMRCWHAPGRRSLADGRAARKPS